ncbi:hypothetical protein Tco_1154941 [Tanacetum coccineum]
METLVARAYAVGVGRANPKTTLCHVTGPEVSAIKDVTFFSGIITIRRLETSKTKKATATIVPDRQKISESIPEDFDQLKIMRRTVYHDLELGACSVSSEDLEAYLGIEHETTRWFALLSDYDCDIRYHPRKANVIADALSWKEREPPLRVQALVMTISLDLPKQILNAQTDERNQENIKNENVGGVVNCFGDLRDLLIMPSPNIEYSIHQVRIQISVRVTSDSLGTSLDLSTALSSAKLKDKASYHASIKAAPFEALYGRKCRSPVCWTLTGPEIVQETTEKIIQVKQRMQAAHDRQKSYADLKRKPMEFEVGDKVMLKGWRRCASMLERPMERSRVHIHFMCQLRSVMPNEPFSRSVDGLLLMTASVCRGTLRGEITDRKLKRLKRKPYPISQGSIGTPERSPEFTWEREVNSGKELSPLFYTKCSVVKCV